MTPSPHILVADDEPRVRDLTRRALVKQGFTCDVASDGEEAFRLAGTTPYQGVVTDLRMPNRHGHALCSDLMRLPSPPRVIVVTALSDARLFRDLIRRGVHDVIQKPFDYDVLVSKVRRMVESDAPAPASTLGVADHAQPTVSLLHQIENGLAELTEQCGERLDTAFDHQDELPEPPRAVREFIKRLAEGEPRPEPPPTSLPAGSMRRQERVTCFATATATPLDRDWQPVCAPFKLALRDLSLGGVRLLHSRAVNCEYLALRWNATQLAATQLRVVCHVRRCKPCGIFYDIGGEFATAD